MGGATWCRLDLDSGNRFSPAEFRSIVLAGVQWRTRTVAGAVVVVFSSCSRGVAGLRLLDQAFWSPRGKRRLDLDKLVGDGLVAAGEGSGDLCVARSCSVVKRGRGPVVGQSEKTKVKGG